MPFIFNILLVLLAHLSISLITATDIRNHQRHNPNQADRHLENSTSVIQGRNGTITLKGRSNSSSTIVLDYGHDVEGFPTFQVVSASGDTSELEITYSETRAILESSITSDGPVGLAAAMDTYRINRYNITGPLTHTNRLIQGGFRFQKLQLSTPGELVLENVGVKPTTSTVPITSLPGSFECSDNDLTQIWRTGARTIQLNEIPAFTIPNYWQITPEGSFVESQAPQVLFSDTASGMMQYKLNFDVKPVANGFSFSILASTLNMGIYIFCNIANGSISAKTGTTEATSGFLASAVLPANITLGNWQSVQAVVDMTEISISIDGFKVLHFSQSASFAGSFGLGAALGHSAFFRNLSATTLTGDMIYASQLTDESFLPDFLMGTNPLNTAVDGSKRDRISYTGDLDIAVGSTMVSTHGTEYLQGTLDLVGSFQLTPGFFVPTAKIQQKPLAAPIDANITGLIGYSFNLLTAVASFYQQTGNLTVAKEWAPKIVAMLHWAESQVLPSNELLNISNAAFGGDWNYYDPVQHGIVTKFNMVYAYSLQSCLTLLGDVGIDVEPYVSRLNSLRKAINAHLWSSDLGAYFLSESVVDGFGQDSNALAILAGVTNSEHTSSQVLSTLTQLSTPNGPLAFSDRTYASGFAKLISPYASAYHLRAALSESNEAIAKELLKTLWKPMADPVQANYTGCFWETLDENGGPGLGAITSLCHAWGAGPTGELSFYVLGIQPVKPGFREWQVSPLTLGLQWA
ncbi:glycoside hydrolase family 78 protein, partial [Corynespora cassiicola Philippines]